jgi:hypothetical protein
MARVHCGTRGSAILIAMATSLAACGTAESGEADGGRPVDDVAEVPAGTLLVFTVDESVSTDSHARGDEFTATLESDAIDSEGAAVLLGGALSRWVVIQSTETDEESALAVELDAVRVGGEWVPLVGEVVSADVAISERESDGETAAKIGIGAAAGAVLGRVIGGDAGGTAAGAGVGAVVGTAVALSDKDGNATLPAGSTITIRLTQPLVTS